MPASVPVSPEALSGGYWQVPILQVGKLRLREVRWRVSGHATWIHTQVS